MTNIRVVNASTLVGLHIAETVVTFRREEGVVNLLCQGYVIFESEFQHGGYRVVLTASRYTDLAQKSVIRCSLFAYFCNH